MKTKYLSLLTFMLLLLPAASWAQSAADVLERGVKLKEKEKVYLKYRLEQKDMQFQLSDTKDLSNFMRMEDSLVLLVPGRVSSINLLLEPLNPLNYSYNSNVTYVVDPINSEAIEVIEGYLSTLFDTESSMSKDLHLLAVEEKGSDCIEGLKEINDKFKEVADRLTNAEPREEIKNLFKMLKRMDFETEAKTADSLQFVSQSMSYVWGHYQEISDILDDIKDDIAKYKCDLLGSYTTKYVVGEIHGKFVTAFEEQKKRYQALEKAYGYVLKSYNDASEHGKWELELSQVHNKKDSVAHFTLTIYSNGLDLSDEGEIVGSPKAVIETATIRVRRFQWFVPEVSVGTAYTFFEYNTYGTTSDSTGQQYVGGPTKNLVRNLNITAMVNFNLYIPDSPVRPFYQLGLGINAGIPTLLTGLGLRTNIGKARFAVSGGMAMTWLKELNNLKVGDPVSGTSDIEDDLKFQFSWPPKPYVGIQYNF